MKTRFLYRIIIARYFTMRKTGGLKWISIFMSICDYPVIDPTSVMHGAVNALQQLEPKRWTTRTAQQQQQQQPELWWIHRPTPTHPHPLTHRPCHMFSHIPSLWHVAIIHHRLSHFALCALLLENFCHSAQPNTPLDNYRSDYHFFAL